jgi:hypothetical protein
MLKRENWQALQEHLERTQYKPPPSNADWARLFARLAKEVSSPSKPETCINDESGRHADHSDKSEP